ncbi:MAG TPA: hypothetical protein VHU23_12370 [Rhizomicrobium sp.]|jgi:hypothetical protein|nr:hypothetical protein [Rhizomicrobium sp.]
MNDPALFEGLCLRAWTQNGQRPKELSIPGMARILFRQLGNPEDLSKVDLSELKTLARELEDEQQSQFYSAPPATIHKQTAARGKTGAIEALETANALSENLRKTATVNDGKTKLSEAEKTMMAAWSPQRRLDYVREKEANNG